MRKRPEPHPFDVAREKFAQIVSALRGERKPSDDDDALSFPEPTVIRRLKCCESLEFERLKENAAATSRVLDAMEVLSGASEALARVRAAGCLCCDDDACGGCPPCPRCRVDSAVRACRALLDELRPKKEGS
jgi:hypothetical protein